MRAGACHRRSWLALALSAWLLAGCQSANETTQTLDVYIPPQPEADAEAGTTTLTADAGAGPIDRDGHPLVAVVLVPSQLDDGFNGQPSFGDNLPRTYQDAIEARLVELDTLTLPDGGVSPVDWPVPDGGAHPLLPAFVSDTLLVDTSLPCAGDAGFVPSYFDLDREVYLGTCIHSTCSGRTPAEDVVSKTMSLLVSGQGAECQDAGQGGAPPAISQGVAGPTKPPTLTFPYLASPN